jgi:hypothetical protein
MVLTVSCASSRHGLVLQNDSTPEDDDRYQPKSIACFFGFLLGIQSPNFQIAQINKNGED